MYVSHFSNYHNYLTCTQHPVPVPRYPMLSSTLIQKNPRLHRHYHPSALIQLPHSNLRLTLLHERSLHVELSAGNRLLNRLLRQLRAQVPPRRRVPAVSPANLSKKSHSSFEGYVTAYNPIVSCSRASVATCQESCDKEADDSRNR